MAESWKSPKKSGKIEKQRKSAGKAEELLGWKLENATFNFNNKNCGNRKIKKIVSDKMVIGNS